MNAREFERIGKRLFDEHLVSGNFGNMSVKVENGLYITSTGSFLDEAGNPVFISLEGDTPAQASSEFRVHREVYLRTRHSAVVHAHPPHAVAVSLVVDEIVPKDSEGQMLCPIIPVVHGRPVTDELAQNVADALSISNVVVASGHGTFAAGKTLEEAYLFTSIAEHACQVLWFTMCFKQ